MEVLLWTLGIACLGWVAWVWADASLYQQRADAALEPPTAGEPVDVPTFATESPDPPATVPITTEPGEAMGRLAIPALDLRVVVAHGVDERSLRRAVGWMPSTVPPGSRTGNVGLAGHRDSFFRDLEGIRVGDEVRLETRAGDAVYRVEWIRVVEPRDVGVVGPTGYPALTLVTCYPFRWVGPAPQRYVVRARRVDEAAAEDGPPGAFAGPPVSPVVVRDLEAEPRGAGPEDVAGQDLARTDPPVVQKGPRAAVQIANDGRPPHPDQLAVAGRHGGVRHPDVHLSPPQHGALAA